MPRRLLDLQQGVVQGPASTTWYQSFRGRRHIAPAESSNPQTEPSRGSGRHPDEAPAPGPSGEEPGRHGQGPQVALGPGPDVGDDLGGAHPSQPGRFLGQEPVGDPVEETARWHRWGAMWPRSWSASATCRSTSGRRTPSSTEHAGTRQRPRAAQTAASSTASSWANAPGAPAGVIWPFTWTTAERVPSDVDAANWV
jgi:hypothetical protein